MIGIVPPERISRDDARPLLVVVHNNIIKAQIPGQHYLLVVLMGTFHGLLTTTTTVEKETRRRGVTSLHNWFSLSGNGRCKYPRYTVSACLYTYSQYITIVPTVEETAAEATTTKKQSRRDGEEVVEENNISIMQPNRVQSHSMY